MSIEQARQPWGGRVSDWHDPLDGAMAEIAGRYGARVPRSDVEMVDALRAALGLARPRLTVVVVGSNGKTSTATYLSELFTAAGYRTGLYTSPHIAYWTERVRIDDVPVEGPVLVEAVNCVDGLAQSEQLHDERFRFFDVLTLAAAKVFADAEVDVAVYEAGIGGRADVTRCLRPELVVLTSVGLEHTELLGDSEEEILRHKLDVAPLGATVIAGALPDGLVAVARAHGHAAGTEVQTGVPGLPAANGLPLYLARNWKLAQAAARVGLERIGGGELPTDVSAGEVWGRFTRVVRDGVQCVVDVAHNPQAWEAFLSELRRRLSGDPAVAVVALTAERAMSGFAETIATSGLFTTVHATTTTVRPTHDPELVAAALRGAGQPAVSSAVPREALERAAADVGRGGHVAVFGSSYLVTDALAWLDIVAPHGDSTTDRWAAGRR
jgi:dihydrofolate synthase/folylpolyglutamate synthase